MNFSDTTKALNYSPMFMFLLQIIVPCLFLLQFLLNLDIKILHEQVMTI